MTYTYPAVFTWYEPEKVYLVDFPDADNWFTEGYSLDEAIIYATDVLNAMLMSAEDCGIPIPKASKIEDIKPESKNSFVQYVAADTEFYRETLQLKKILDIKKRIKAKKVKRHFKKKEASL